MDIPKDKQALEGALANWVGTKLTGIISLVSGWRLTEGGI